MSVCLATTWYPRGEFSRLERLLPTLLESYSSIVLILLPNEDEPVLARLQELAATSGTHLCVIMNEDKRSGRYKALQHSLETGVDYIHYVDMDRLLHWVETHLDEWQQMVSVIPGHDCIIFERTPAAWKTHPRSLSSTEQISNQVVSSVLDQQLDASAGSKSFSRVAAQYLVDHSSPDRSIGADAEWPILISQAGYQVQKIQVDGLEWESADQYHDQAVIGEEQAQAAREYDADPAHWQKRVEIASEIVDAALRLSGETVSLPAVSSLEFVPDAVFDVDDYLYFYSEALTDERTETEVSGIVSLLSLSEPRDILDLACGFGRYTNRLAALGHHLTGVDRSDEFLDLAKKDAAQRNIDVRYIQGDMRHITYENEFDVVLLLFTAFGYFTDTENQQVLANIRRALRPGGRLLFDCPNRDTFLKTMQPVYVHERDGNMMIDRMSFDSMQGRSMNQRVVFRDGIRKEKPFSIRLYNPNEIQMLVARAGLILEYIYGGWEGDSVTSDTRRLIVIARKPG